MLGRAETARGGGPEPLRHPPILIVGAPRSGSTLLYQALVQGFDVGYLSNRHCRLWGAPSLVERATPFVARPRRSTRASGRRAARTHRASAGRSGTASSAGGRSTCRSATADPAQLRRLRAAVRALGNAAGRPLVFKNLLCTLRLEPIGTALPEAVFVVIRRDLVANAASVLEARRTLHGDYDTWWSAEPPEVDDLRALPAHEQAVEQVRRIEALVDRDRERLGAHRFLELRYEELCDDPHGALAAVAGLARGERLHARAASDDPGKVRPVGRERARPSRP